MSVYYVLCIFCSNNFPFISDSFCFVFIANHFLILLSVNFMNKSFGFALNLSDGLYAMFRMWLRTKWTDANWNEQKKKSKCRKTGKHTNMIPFWYVFAWLVFSPHTHVIHIPDNFPSSIFHGIAVVEPNLMPLCHTMWHWIVMFTTSYYYLIPMQWFLSTQPLKPNQYSCLPLSFWWIESDTQRKRKGKRMNGRTTQVSIPNLKHEKLDAIILDIQMVYIEWGKVMWHRM